MIGFHLVYVIHNLQLTIFFLVALLQCLFQNIVILPRRIKQRLVVACGVSRLYHQFQQQTARMGIIRVVDILLQKFNSLTVILMRHGIIYLRTHRHPVSGG